MDTIIILDFVCNVAQLLLAVYIYYKTSKTNNNQK